MAAMPCIDGEFITMTAGETLESGMQKNIPYLMGSTSHDIVPPFVFEMAKNWCAVQSAQGKQDSFCWFFDRMLPGDDCGAWHSSDLWYWFGTLKNCWRPFTEHDEMLSETMIDYLCNFVKSGNPNGEGLVEWEVMRKADNKVLRLGEKDIRMDDVDMEWLHEIMRTNVAVGE